MEKLYVYKYTPRYAEDGGEVYYGPYIISEINAIKKYDIRIKHDAGRGRHGTYYSLIPITGLSVEESLNAKNSIIRENEENQKLQPSRSSQSFQSHIIHHTEPCTRYMAENNGKLYGIFESKKLFYEWAITQIDVEVLNMVDCYRILGTSERI